MHIMFEEEVIRTGETPIVPLFSEAAWTQYTLPSCGKVLQTFTRSITNISRSQAELFADNIWPGALVMADILDNNPHLCAGKNVIELGAGCALPSMVASVLDSKCVVVTDYPDPSVINNIENVVTINKVDNAVVRGHTWGDTTENLIQIIAPCTKFELVILAELLWKDTFIQHEALLKSVSQCLCYDTGIVLVTFVHRSTTTHAIEKDLEFFQRAQEKFHLNYRKLGVVRKYADAFSDENGCNILVDVQLYVLFGSADVERISI